MKFFQYIFLYVLYCKNSLSENDLANVPFKPIFYRKEFEIMKNEVMGVGCVDFILHNVKNSIKTKKEFIELFQYFEYKEPTFPAKILISITYYDLNVRILSEYEMEKIIKYIIDIKDNQKITHKSDSVFILDVIKIHKSRTMSDFFDLMPDFVSSGSNTIGKFAPCFYHFFISEDICKNDRLKILIRSHLKYFFKNSSLKFKDVSKTYISLLASYKNYNLNFLFKICKKIKRLVEIKKYISKVGLTKCEAIINREFYKIDLNFIFFVRKNFKNIFNESTVNSKEIYKKNFEIKQDLTNKYLIDFIKFSSYDIFLKIQKIDYILDAGDKLFNFLGYGPLINRFTISYKTINYEKLDVKYDILVVLDEKGEFNFKKDTVRGKKWLKTILISKYDEIELSELFKCSYVIDDKNLVGFPLTVKERDTVEEQAENNDINACNLLNFINLYESFILAQGYFYFHMVYNKNSILTEKVTFYQKEINFYDILENEIHILILNAFRLGDNVTNISTNKFLKNLKRVEVYSYEICIFNKFRNSDQHTEKDILNGLKDHYIDKIELCFYDNIKRLESNKFNFNDSFIEYFIKIDLGYNKEYLILFRKSAYENSRNEKICDIDFIIKKSIEFLSLDFSKIINEYDQNTHMLKLKDFVTTVFDIIKDYLFENIKIEELLFPELKKRINSFMPQIQEIIENYFDFNNQTTAEMPNSITNFYNKIKFFEIFLNKLIFIFRKFIHIKRHEVYILVSLLNEKDESDLIFEYLRNN